MNHLKMKPLATNQRVLTWLNLHPADETAKRMEKAAYALVYLTIAVVYLTLFASSVMYFLKFISVDLKESLAAVIQIAPAISLLNAMVFTFLLRNKTAAVFKKLSDIYEASKKKYQILLRFLPVSL